MRILFLMMQEKYVNLSQQNNKMIQLWPHIHNVDGFFIARMLKNK